MATNESDLLGRLAEQEFGTWATRGDITVNKAEVDRHGWDFILQIPYSAISKSSAPSLDKLGPEIFCKIQVKSTEQTKNSCDDINLENWSRMIAEPIPWFVAILIYESRILKEAFLVHIDEKLISRALDRLRQVPDSEKDTLHKKFMSLSWSEDDKLLPPFHDALIQGIMKPLKTGMFDYAETKRRFYQSLGYNERPIHIAVTLRSPDANDLSSLYDTLADHALGLNDSMPVTSLSFSDVRFGIAQRDMNAIRNPDKCRIEDPKVDVGTISFYDSSRITKNVDIECTLYHSGIVFPFLPREFHRIKIQARFFSIIIDPRDTDLRIKTLISIPTDQAETMRELLKYARFVSICAGGIDGSAKFKLNLAKSKAFRGMEFGINANFTEETVMSAQLIEHLWDVMRFFDIDKDTKIKLDDIWNQEEIIEFFRDAVYEGSSQPDGLISFKAAADIPEQQAALVIGNYLIIGTFAIVAIVAFIGQCKLIAGEHKRRDTDDADTMQSYQVVNIIKEVCRKETYLWQEGTNVGLSNMLEEVCQILKRRVPIVMAPQLEPDNKAARLFSAR